MLKDLHEVIGEKMTVNITVVKKGEELVIMVGAKVDVDDSAFDNIPPFTASGNPEQVEKELIEAFKEPFKRLSGTVSGVAEFESKQKEIEKENKAAQAEKDLKKKEAEKQEKAIGKLLEKGNAAIEEKKDVTATQIEAQIKAILGDSENKDFSTFTENLKQLKIELGTKTLF